MKGNLLVMEKTNKVVRVVLSIVTFVAITLYVISLFALPIQSSVSGGTTVNSNIYDFIKAFNNEIKNMQTQGGDYVTSHIGVLFSLLITIVFTLVFGIIALVKSIVLLVKTINGMSGKGEYSALLKSLVSFGTFIVVFIALLLGIISASQPGTKTGLGSGTELMLSIGIISLSVAGVYFIATKDDRKLVNKILGLATSMLAIIGVLLIFAYSLKGEGNQATYGLFWLFTGFVQIIASSAQETSLIVGYTFAVVGMVAIIVGLGMAKSVMVNGFAIDIDNKKPGFEKSSIIKSSVWLGLDIIGVILIAIGLNKAGLSVGGGAIGGIVVVALALGGAITNKALMNKFAAPKQEETKAE